MLAKHKFLSFDQQVEHWRRWKAGDENSWKVLYDSHELFILKIARYYAKNNPTADFDDIKSAADSGFLTALQRFNPDYKCIIATYAERWIKESIKRDIPKISHGQSLNHKAAVAVRAVKTEIDKSLEARPPLTAIYNKVAEDLGRTAKEIQKAYEKAMRRTYSLDAPVDGEADGNTFGDFLVDDNAADPLAGIETERMNSILRDALGTLEPRMKRIVALRFGLERYGDEGATLDEIGQEFNISKERIRQLEVKAMGKLRESLAKAGIDESYLALKA